MASSTASSSSRSKCSLEKADLVEILKDNVGKVGSHFKIEKDETVVAAYEGFLVACAEKSDRLNKTPLIEALKEQYGKKAPWIQQFAERMVHLFSLCRSKKGQMTSGTKLHPAVMKVVSCWLDGEEETPRKECISPATASAATVPCEGDRKGKKIWWGQQEPIWPVPPVEGSSSSAPSWSRPLVARLPTIDVDCPSPPAPAGASSPLPESQAEILALYGCPAHVQKRVLTAQESCVSVNSSENDKELDGAAASSSRKPAPLAEAYGERERQPAVREQVHELYINLLQGAKFNYQNKTQNKDVQRSENGMSNCPWKDTVSYYKNMFQKSVLRHLKFRNLVFKMRNLFTSVPKAQRQPKHITVERASMSKCPWKDDSV